MIDKSNVASCTEVHVLRSGRTVCLVIDLLDFPDEVCSFCLAQHDELRRQASRIEKHLRLSWSKVDRMVESVRCMLGLLSSTQL
jgi:hypothetical protein